MGAYTCDTYLTSAISLLGTLANNAVALLILFERLSASQTFIPLARMEGRAHAHTTASGLGYACCGLGWEESTGDTVLVETDTVFLSKGTLS